jgi:hypothetical protein
VIGNWTPGALKPPGRAGRAGVMNPNVWVTFQNAGNPPCLSLSAARGCHGYQNSLRTPLWGSSQPPANHIYAGGWQPRHHDES